MGGNYAATSFRIAHCKLIIANSTGPIEIKKKSGSLHANNFKSTDSMR